MKNKKVIYFITNLLLILLLMTPCVNATIDITITNITPSQLPGIKAVTLIGVIKWIGYLVGIGMFIYVGIKYLLAGAGEKAKAKETLIPILIGAVLVTSGTAITAAVFSTFGYN